MNLRFARVASLTLPLFVLFACGGDDDDRSSSGVAGGGDAGAGVCGQTPPAQKPAALCEVTIESPPISGWTHVTEGTPVAYCGNSNPPSSGNHYPVWAYYQEYSAPVDWPYLVHNMEHGAVVLLYKCDPPGCPDVVAQLRQVRDGAADPECAPEGTKRVIIAPSPSSPTILTKVAAAAWGKTYQADCVDVPTLDTFVRDNIGKGRELVCGQGRTF